MPSVGSLEHIPSGRNRPDGICLLQQLSPVRAFPMGWNRLRFHPIGNRSSRRSDTRFSFRHAPSTPRSAPQIAACLARGEALVSAGALKIAWPAGRRRMGDNSAAARNSPIAVVAVCQNVIQPHRVGHGRRSWTPRHEGSEARICVHRGSTTPSCASDEQAARSSASLRYITRSTASVVLPRPIRAPPEQTAPLPSTWKI
jgi:hypothetical protein